MATIGVLSPVTGGFYYGRVLAGINRVLQEVGGRIVFVQTLDAGISSDEVVAAPDFRKRIGWDHLDGVISIATGTQRRYLELLLARGIPVVVASDVIDGLAVPAAVPDNAGGVMAAVDHLAGHGHTRIGFAANLLQSDMRERHEGYRDALTARHLELRDDWFFDAPDNGELGGAAVAHRLLAAGMPVSALVLATDRNAIGCIETLAEHGVRVPEELAVVGFDGIDTGAYSTPALTTVGQRFDDIGAAAARLLLARIAGEPVADRPHPIPADLIVRESCGCCPADATDRSATADAVEFWRAEAALHLDRSQRRERWMREQYEIGIRLLDHDLAAPQHLEWLEATGVRAAELALWDGDPSAGTVRIAGAYVRDGDPCTAEVGSTLPVTAFPTANLLARSETRPDEVTIVVPVAARGQDFGLLAVVSEVDALSANGRETHNQWAALLTTALDQQLLHDQLRTSEERYSLWALATNDGLWDWDRSDGQIYYSGRCMEMLGHEYRSVTGPPSVWLDRVHPDDRDRMRRAMARAATQERETVELEHRVKGRDDAYRRVIVRALPVGPPGLPATRVVGSVHDVEARRQLEEQLRRGALYDDVTGLPNRRLFLERLEAAIARERHGGPGYAVAFFDLDGFKLVNDSLGHLAGDRLLAEVGERLRRRLRRSDVAARFGGDEFAVLLNDIPTHVVATTVADVLSDIRQPVDLEGHAVAVSASTGITTSDVGYCTPDEVIRDADLAMYRAKSSRDGSAVMFDVALRADGLMLTSVPARRG
jgi:diguanylate cyclase (GGDEF)-like protein/PAS domain S-box-containing protein